MFQVTPNFTFALMVGDEVGGVLAEDSLFELCDCLLDCESSILKQRNLKGYIPYASIYDELEEVRKRGYFIPGRPVTARIVSAIRDEESHVHVLNAFLYTIELTHGKYVWRVTKRFTEFLNLHRRLITHRAAERLKAPVWRSSAKFEDVLKIVAANNYHHSDCPLYKLFNEQQSKVQTLNYSKDDGMGLDAIKVIETPVEEVPHTPGDESVRAANHLMKENYALPKIPKVPEFALSGESIEERKEQLEKWLQAVLATPINRNYHETAEFLEISRYSFINQLEKYREGPMKKRPGGARVFLGWKQCCVRYFLKWSNRWLIMKDTYLCYMHPSDSNIRLVLLFDDEFAVNSSDLEITFKVRDLVLSNKEHVLHMKCKTIDEVGYWNEQIKHVLEGPGKIWLEKHPYGSSFPVRKDCYSKWFVDAKEYWEYAADMIELAQEEVFIADWWLCPHVYMKRPMTEGDKWRLDVLLNRKASQGVKIFILVYKEMEMALNLNSLWMKKHMQGLHPNIMVMRHPDHYPSTGTFFWAHHEKLLIIDQIIAFVGGLDLCYGRWDDNEHRLTDLGSIQKPTTSNNTNTEFNLMSGMRQVAGLSASLCPSGMVCTKEEDTSWEEAVADSEANVTEVKDNNIINSASFKGNQKPISKIGSLVNKLKSSSFKSNSQAKPVVNKSVAVTMKDAGGSQTLNVPVRDSTGSQYDVEVILEPNHNRMSRSRSRSRSKSPGGYESGVDMTPDGNTKDFIIDEKGEKKKVWGRARQTLKDTTRAKVGKIVSHWGTKNMKSKWKDVLNDDSAMGQYEMNWLKLTRNNEDIKKENGLVGGGKMWLGKDYVNYLKRDFIDVDQPFSDFVDRTKVHRMPWHDIHSVTFGTAARDVARHFIQRWNATKTEKLKSANKYPYLIPKSYESVRIPRIFFGISVPTTVQVIRSVSNWSALVNRTEDSIQQAYLSLIDKSQHYIYIENQFFVSMVDSPDVLNLICEALVKRIVRADKNKETFRLYILIPLLPGFEGELSSQAATTSLHTVLHWTLVSIDNSPHSLYANIRKEGVDPDKYISFCSLRTHSVLWGKMVTELVYIHCKLMIVDDNQVIIGSANINDRSQVGNRDSEVCLLFTDNEYENSKMNGSSYKAGKFAKSLRLQLMKEHLGMLEESTSKTKNVYDLNDPSSDTFFNLWNSIARTNTNVFEKVFRCFPTDKVETLEELDKWNLQMPLSELDPKEAHESLKTISGQLVEFPRKFLIRQNLQPALTSKEGLVPSSVFT
uniref:Phospholipase n=1 Tax=Rhabditophanes sp. KR3021 TaxID=114890 RepID=A0AC35U608_9BILA